MSYTNVVNNKKTPQTKKMLGTNQVKNNAGGYVYEIDMQSQLERFLTLGTLGGTFYVGKQELTEKNAEVIVNYIKTNPLKVYDTVKDFITNNRVMKLDASIFTLALLVTHAEQKVKNDIYSGVSVLLKTSTHLFTFVQYCNDLRGWSAGLRKAVARWYKNKTNEKLAYQIVKYRQRNGWTHKDVMRLSHVKPSTEETNFLYKYIVGKFEGEDYTKLPKLINGFELAKRCEASINVGVVNDLVRYISEYKLTWEMIPTKFLNNKDVLKALLPNMPMTALIRNLNRFTASGLFDGPFNENVSYVVSKLTDVNNLKENRIHPVTLLNTYHVYQNGHGDKGSLTWTPNPKVSEALVEGFELSFSTQEPTGKKILIATDISGSMTTAGISNLSLTAAQASVAMALTYLKSETNVDIVGFDTKLHTNLFTKKDTYKTCLAKVHGGGTDCSLPFQYLTRYKALADVLIMFTDNETWAGNTHAIQAVEEYRKKVNPNFKVIVVGMVATQFNILPPDYPNSLMIAGFDASIPQLVNDFITKI